MPFTEFEAPAIGDGSKSLAIMKWEVPDGATISAGEIIATLETDKVTCEVEAFESGRIEQLQKEGANVPLGTVIARIHHEGHRDSLDLNLKLQLTSSELGNLDRACGTQSRQEYLSAVLREHLS